MDRFLPGPNARLALLCALLFNVAGLICAYGTEPASPGQTKVEVIDATTSFWKFWSASERKAEDERVQLFLDEVVGAHPDLFGNAVLGEDAITGESRIGDAGARVAAFLRDVAPHISRMREISNSIDRDFRTWSEDFSRTFPDYARTTPVYFTVSLFSFDGGTRLLGGKTALLFGIDGIALDGPDLDLKVLFDHELFHQYHDQIAPELAKDDVPLWISLWEEGLATYVSQQMSPASTEAQVLMFPRNLAELAQPKLPVLVQELLANFDSFDKDEYAAFFYGRNRRADVPPRSGYFVGYRIAQKLSKGKSLQELARLRGPELKAAVKLALRQLAPGP